jgi:hypothetical protein
MQAGWVDVYKLRTDGCDFWVELMWFLSVIGAVPHGYMYIQLQMPRSS